MKPNLLTINQLTTNNQALTMSSLEISELVQSRHDSVKRTIETLVNQGVIACPQTVDVQEVKGNNRTYTTQAYLFIGEQGKLDSITVVAQLCPQFTAKLVKRWYELEQSATITDPLLLIAHMATQAYEAKQLALKQEQRLCHIEQKVDVAIAKAQAVLDDDGYFSIKGFCSLHGIKLTNSQMSSLSKKCKKLSDVKDIPYQETTDPRWGKVKMYYREILAEVFHLSKFYKEVKMQNTKENQATIGNLIDELIDSVVDDNTHDNCVQRQIDKLKQVIFSGGWISVNDELPPNNTPVLICLDDDVVVCELGLQNNITIACYDNGHGDDLPCWLSVESQDCSSVVMPIIISPSEVAYWQALPSPPVQKEQK